MAALQALEMMQVLPSDSADGEFSDNEEYEAVNAVEAVAELEAESSDFEDEKTVAVLPHSFRSKENMGLSHDQNQPADSTNADTPQPIQSKDRSLWMLATTSKCVQGRLQQQNIINFCFSPTSYTAHCIQ